MSSPGSARGRLWRALGAPLRDLEAGLDGALERRGRGVVLLLAGLIAGWWLYVPVHELLHAGACLLAGGTVERLEIAPLYGGALLAEIFPFVVAGGEYAGRLAGFDDRGRDGVYLATVLGPFVLTVFPGVWALRRAAKSPLGFGFWLPFALAPFLSLTGDAYEIGSILLTRLPPWTESATLLRGDDVFRVAAAVEGSLAWLGLLLAFVLGAVWAFATYALGSWWAMACRRRWRRGWRRRRRDRGARP